MDEILIGEKKYVSSKRAAKMTGYAKDYIGQLCREGRVPARLVGRSWYVLESAIQDHRFGDQKNEQEKQAINESPSPVVLPAWESPRYENDSAEILPSVNRAQRSLDDSNMENVESSPSIDTNSEDTMAERLQDSWRAWFDHMGGSTAGEKIIDPEPITPHNIENTDEESRNSESVDGEIEENDTNIPIRVVREEIPRELLPVRSTKNRSYKAYTREIEYEKEIPYETNIRRKSFILRTIQTIGTVFAVISLVLAIIGSGYLDTYILSFSQADIISGGTTYNK